MRLNLPFDRETTIEVEIPEENLIQVVTPRYPKPKNQNDYDTIRHAINYPIRSPLLREMVGPQTKVAIVVTDITRFAHDKEISEVVLRELERGEVKKDNIFFLLALGSHRPMTSEEIEDKLGEEIVSSYPIFNHDCQDSNALAYLGETEGGFPVFINKKLLEADLKITLGVIEPHLFAGYSGGVKTICVGLAGVETLNATHSLPVLSHSTTRLGVVKNNSFRNFLNQVAEKVGVDFTLNLVLNSEKRVVEAFAGHPIFAFERAVAFAKHVFEVPVQEVADVVISCPGYPKSINLYQATRAANSVVKGPKPVVKKGGKILIPARCQNGLGEESFYHLMSQFEDICNLREYILREGFTVGEHKAFILSEILTHASLIMTNCEIEKENLAQLFIENRGSLAKAVKEILDENPKSRFLVLPQGIMTIPILK
ncbi:MAG: hypothetical protein PWP04_1786 [Candidatus Atribacteria bacterium]|nr:hypothetical protein [Candidatus Atribacteria bacterium]